MTKQLIPLLDEIRHCQLCKAYLPFPPQPIIQANSSAQLLIIGQAPGLKVQQTGIPWNDASGDRLRLWLQMDKADFYNPARVAIMPMGLCYPGKGKTGDLPPRKECAPAWHKQVLELLPNIQLTLLIGQYAQTYYLNDNFKSISERLQHRELLPANTFILPHPSPRNRHWFNQHPVFEQEVLVELQAKLSKLTWD